MSGDEPGRFDFHATQEGADGLHRGAVLQRPLASLARQSYNATVSAVQSCPRTRTKSSNGEAAACVDKYSVRRFPTFTFCVTDSRRAGRIWRVGISAPFAAGVPALALPKNLRDDQRGIPDSLRPQQIF